MISLLWFQSGQGKAVLLGGWGGDNAILVVDSKQNYHSLPPILAPVFVQYEHVYML